ncbi:hypothetical protein SODG_000144 [Sodalis praecaptivus]
MSGSLDDLRKKILENFPKIEDVLTRIVRGMIRAGERVGRVIWRLIQAAGQIFDWWRNLDGQSKKVITTFGALTAAILLLWDDYQTWKEGESPLLTGRSGDRKSNRRKRRSRG